MKQVTGTVSQSCLTLQAWIIALQAPVYRILQARTLEWTEVPFSRGSSQGLNLGLLHCRQILHQ